MNNDPDDYVPPRPLSPGEEIIYHPLLGMVPEWTAKSWDKARINDLHYPAVSPRALAAALAAADDAGAVHFEETAKTTPPPPAAAAEEEERTHEAEAALVRELVAKVDALADKMAALETARAERLERDAALERELAPAPPEPADEADDEAPPPVPPAALPPLIH
jgi:hypothetical protein